MSYKDLCRWCMRHDCKEKGGTRVQCPIDRNEGPDEETTKATLEYQEKVRTELNKRRRERQDQEYPILIKKQPGI